MQNPSTPENPAVGLADVLAALGSEIRLATERASAAGVNTVRAHTAEVELAVTVEGAVGGGIKFWVVNADASSSTQHVGRVKVMLSIDEEWGQGM